jgi:hypothetical protein
MPVAEPLVHPAEEAFGTEEATVEALVDGEDAGEGETAAWWLPHGATLVGHEARETALERELEILGA